MTTPQFSVPYNSDEKTLDEVLAFARQTHAVREVYLSGPEEFSASGRVARAMDAPTFARLAAKIHAAGVRVNLVMNTTCEGVEWYETDRQRATRAYLEWACGEVGVESVTIANPLYLKSARRWLPDVELCASVLMDVDCVERAKIAEEAGANVVTPDVNINRDLGMLERIVRETQLELKIMVNEGCLYKCPWRKFHFNAVSHIGSNAGRVGYDLSPEEFVAQCTQVAYGVFFDSCNGQIARDPSQLLLSQWIRPEDLGLYSGVCTYFKLSGRTMPRQALMTTLAAYVNGAYEGNLFDLLDSSVRSFALRSGAAISNAELGRLDFGRRTLACSHTCHECGFCRETAEHLVTYHKEP